MAHCRCGQSCRRHQRQNVARLTPKAAAAAPGWPPCASRAASACWRRRWCLSAGGERVGVSAAAPDDARSGWAARSLGAISSSGHSLCSSLQSTVSMLRCDARCAAKRSHRFSSSRTLPGQPWRCRASPRRCSTASAGVCATPSRARLWRSRCCARAGMSSLRSRNAGSCNRRVLSR